jgi:hypothetical protein
MPLIPKHKKPSIKRVERAMRGMMLLSDEYQVATSLRNISLRPVYSTFRVFASTKASHNRWGDTLLSQKQAPQVPVFELMN